MILILHVFLLINPQPKFCIGTVNIHPSLLPLYRGAAPVQRALQVEIIFDRSPFISSRMLVIAIFICWGASIFIQDGVKETGVSLAFTVRALDAGPVITSQKIGVDDDIKV